MQEDPRAQRPRQHLLSLVFSTLAILTGVGYHRRAGFISVSLMPKDGEPFLKYFLVICISAEALGLDPQVFFYFRSHRIHYIVILNNSVT